MAHTSDRPARPHPGRTTLSLRQLQEVLERPPRPAGQDGDDRLDAGAGVALGSWRWLVRQRIDAVRDALASEAGTGTETWLAARDGALLRERNQLLTRLARLGPTVLETTDVEMVRTELRRLVADVRRHVQRRHDLAYDDVEMELGGSE